MRAARTQVEARSLALLRGFTRRLDLARTSPDSLAVRNNMNRWRGSDARAINNDNNDNDTMEVRFKADVMIIKLRQATSERRSAVEHQITSQIISARGEMPNGRLHHNSSSPVTHQRCMSNLFIETRIALLGILCAE